MSTATTSRMRREQMGAFSGVPDRPAAALHPRRPARRHVCAMVACWSGRPDQGEQAVQAVPRRRRGQGRDGRPDALPGAQLGLRRAVSEGDPAVLEGRLRQGADRRGDRGACRARAPRADRQLDHAPLPDQRRCHDGSGPTDTAFGHRDAKYAMVIARLWTDPADDEAASRWVRDYYARRAPLLRARAATSTSWTMMTRAGAGQLRRQLRSPGRGQARPTTPTTCSASTRTSLRPGWDRVGARGADGFRVPRHPSAADGEPDALELLEVRVARLRHRPAQRPEQVDRAVRGARRAEQHRLQVPRPPAHRSTSPPTAAATGAPPPTSSTGRGRATSAAAVSCSPSITASAPQAIALARSPEWSMPPSAMTCT